MRAFMGKFAIPVFAAGFVLFGLIIVGMGGSTPEPAAQAGQNEGEQQEEAQQKEPSSIGQQDTSLVTFVVDGDTLEIETGQRVRLIGIDTPERGGPYYQEAKAKLQELVLEKQVRLEKDVSDTDRYGRLLRYVYVGDVFVNWKMVQLGYAKAYTYPPDVRHAGKFLAAQEEARFQQKGLWTGQPSPAPAPADASFTLPACAAVDCDCTDFINYAHAQWFHANHNAGDAHRLDSDKDGIACESLP